MTAPALPSDSRSGAPIDSRIPADVPGAKDALSALIPGESTVTGWLDVSGGHRIYYEQGGQVDGLPVLFLHGGPGGACSPRHAELFDLTRCRLTLFDQRGCGRSLPRGSLEANTSDALVADIEALRERLGVARWLVVAGSWGAGLALAYAAAHRHACLGLILRGVFLGRASDVNWFFQDARQFLPDAWAALAAGAPVSAQGNLLPWLADGILGSDAAVAVERALAWEAWESSVTMRQSIARRQPPDGAERASLLAKYRIQSHYLLNQCFWADAPLLTRAAAWAELPTAIVHGRLDWVCRPQAAWDVHQCIAGSRLQWHDGCGHSPFEPAMAASLGQALAQFADHGHFRGWGQSFQAGAAP
jgi:proline iminopeptidase